MRTLRMDRERTWSPAAKNEFADHLSQAQRANWERSGVKVRTRAVGAIPIS